MASQLDALTENISFLKLLDPKISEIGRNDLEANNELDKADGIAQISPRCEKATAEAFAAFLATSENTNKVGAVCVEILSSEPPQLVIRVAANDLDITDRLCDLRTIANAITKCATSGKDPFDAVVRVLQVKILARLRSKHAPRSMKWEKASPVSRLCSLILLSQKYKQDVAAMKSLEPLANRLHRSFNRLEELELAEARGTKGRELLKDMLGTIEKLPISDIERLLTRIPLNVENWDQVGRESFTAKLQKLAHYRHAAEYLTKKAQRNAMYRNITFEGVTNPAFQPTARCSRVQSVKHGVLSRGLTTGSTRTRSGFRKQITACLTKSAEEVQAMVLNDAKLPKRVHAEIQLLLYYEQQPEAVQRPRFICSSKHACFLCNLFIKCHGSYCVPGTHGNVYSPWKLPDFHNLDINAQRVSDLEKCLSRFNEEVETKIKACLAMKKVRSSGPSESVIFKAPSLTPSTMSVLEDEQTANTASHPMERRGVTASLATSMQAVQGDPTGGETLPLEQEKTMPILAKIDSVMQWNCDRPLVRGIEACDLSISLGSPQLIELNPGTNSRIDSQEIELFIDYEGAEKEVNGHDARSSETEGRRAPASEKLLLCELMEDANEEHIGKAIDAHALDRDCVIPLAELCYPLGISLRAGNQVLRIQMIPA